VQDGVNVEPPTHLVSQLKNSHKTLIDMHKNKVIGMLMKTSRGGFMVQTEKLRDWNPGAGSPKSALSERRDFIPKTRR
jgi:hypothetical protein